MPTAIKSPSSNPILHVSRFTRVVKKLVAMPQPVTPVCEFNLMAELSAEQLKSPPSGSPLQKRQLAAITSARKLSQGGMEPLEVSHYLGQTTW